MQKDDYAFSFDIAWRLPCVSHQLSTVVIPVLIKREVRYVLFELYLQFLKTDDSLQFLGSFSERYVLEEIIVQLKFISVLLYGSFSEVLSTEK